MVAQFGDLLVKLSKTALELQAGVVVITRQAGNLLGNVFLELGIILEAGEVFAHQADDVLFDHVGGEFVAVGALVVLAAVVGGADVVARAVAFAAGGGLAVEFAAAYPTDQQTREEVVGVDGGAAHGAMVFLGLLPASQHLVKSLLVDNGGPGVGFDDPIGLGPEFQAFVAALHALAGGVAVPFALGALVIDAAAAVGGVVEHPVDGGDGKGAAASSA